MDQINSNLLPAGNSLEILEKAMDTYKSYDCFQ